MASKAKAAKAIKVPCDAQCARECLGHSPSRCGGAPEKVNGIQLLCVYRGRTGVVGILLNGTHYLLG